MEKHWHCSLIHKFQILCAQSTSKRRIRIEQCQNDSQVPFLLAVFRFWEEIFYGQRKALSLCEFFICSSFVRCSILQWHSTFCHVSQLMGGWKLMSKYLLKANSIIFFLNVFNFTNFMWAKSWNISQRIQSAFSLTHDSFLALSYTNIQHKHCRTLKFPMGLYDI